MPREEAVVSGSRALGACLHTSALTGVRGQPMWAIQRLLIAQLGYGREGERDV
jgi:hypothetical protein